MWARTYTDLLGNYFVDKHHLIHLNASPPMLDERLAKWVEKVLPIGVCIHSVFGALSYTGDASVALMITMSCLSIGGLLFFECWESCKDEEPPQDINMAIPCVVQCLPVSVVGGTVPVGTSRVCLRARMCLCYSFQHFWMHAPYVWRAVHTRLAPGSRAAIPRMLRVLRVLRAPRFLHPLTVVHKIREASDRYAVKAVAPPCRSLYLAHPRCVCTATCTPWLPTSIR